MANESVPNAFGKNIIPGKKTSESSDIKENCAVKDSIDITALVRSLQRTEGNPDCFRKAKGNCDQLDCAWRPYCLKDFPTGG